MRGKDMEKQKIEDIQFTFGSYNIRAIVKRVLKFSHVNVLEVVTFKHTFYFDFNDIQFKSMVIRFQTNATMTVKEDMIIRNRLINYDGIINHSEQSTLDVSYKNQPILEADFVENILGLEDSFDWLDDEQLIITNMSSTDEKKTNTKPICIDALFLGSLQDYFKKVNYHEDYRKPAGYVSTGGSS